MSGPCAFRSLPLILPFFWLDTPFPGFPAGVQLSCSCPAGQFGIPCTTLAARFATGADHASYAVSFAQGVNSLRLAVDVDADTLNGTLLALEMPASNSADFARLELRQGRLMLRFDLGDGEAIAAAPLADSALLLIGGRLVPVQAQILGRLGVVYIGGVEVARERAPGNSTTLNLLGAHVMR